MPKVLISEARLKTRLVANNVEHIKSVQEREPTCQWWAAQLYVGDELYRTECFYCGERPGDVNAPMRRIDMWLEFPQKSGKWAYDLVAMNRPIEVKLFPLVRATDAIEAKIELQRMLADQRGQ